MSRSKRERRCFPCGAVLGSSTALGIHLAKDCPGNRSGLDVAREVHCWACAAPIDLREGPACPACGRVYTLEPTTREARDGR